MKIENNENRQEQPSTSTEKQTFVEPKLQFIQPKLTKHGDATNITHAFFGTFNA